MTILSMIISSLRANQFVNIEVVNTSTSEMITCSRGGESVTFTLPTVTSGALSNIHLDDIRVIMAKNLTNESFKYSINIFNNYIRLL